MEEERAMELEALMAIYMDDFKMVNDNQFTIDLVPNPGSDDDIVGIEMDVTYTASYPAEAPIVVLKSKKGVTKSQLVELENKLKAQAEESIGIAMVFALAQAVKDWLDEHNSEEEEAGDEEDGEDEPKAAEAGTPVTVETFLAWKAAFDIETAELRKSKLDGEKLKRPTGRQLFEIDASLILSDTSLLEEGDQVAVFSPPPNVNWELFADEDLDNS